jgi:predicted nuclease of restriction endonuclease-like (RecB) superfamily
MKPKRQRSDLPSIVQAPLAQLPAGQNDSLPSGYTELLTEVKERIRAAQLRAVRVVNHELLFLYWSIGHEILSRQQQEGWGTKVIARLSADLGREFPEMSGFSARNLKYMRSFAEAYPEKTIVQDVMAQLPWYHNITLLEKVKDSKERIWYLRQAVRHGWSRNVLVHQIESGLFERQGETQTNFERTLPSPQSDLAREILKDPYNFDFLSLGPEAHERDLEQGLIDHVQRFLLELGAGFAFVGRQHHLEIEGDDYYLDLLFYHLTLRCFVVIDLKIGAFKPEDAGKMNFYLSAVDDRLRHADDEPSIGLVLCKTKKRFVVEYALRGAPSTSSRSSRRHARAPPGSRSRSS